MTQHRDFDNHIPLILENKKASCEDVLHSQYPCHVDVLIATEKNRGFFTFEVT